MQTSIAPWGMKDPALALVAERCIAEIAARKSTSIQAWARGEDMAAGSFGGGLSYSSAQQQSSWIYACVNAITSEIANLPFRFSLGKRDGENIIEQADFVELFNQPHPYINKFEFWEMLAGWLLLRGKAFIIGFDKAGQVVRWRSRLNETSGLPATLFILNPDRMQKRTYEGTIASWCYYTSQDEPMVNLELDPDEVLWMRLPLLGDFYEGLAPLSVALLTARGDYAGAQFMKGLMENNADQGMVATTDQKLSQEQRAQIDSALRNRKRMAGRADKPLILEGGLKVEKPGISMVDMQFLEQRKFNRQEICAVFRVAQEIIGFTEDANKSVSQSMRLNFVQFCILPFCARLEAFISPIVQAFDPKLYGWFDDESHPVMIAARRERWDGALKAFSIGVPIDECSRQFDLGLPDDLPHNGKSYLPFSMQEVGTESAAPLPEPGSAADQSNSDGAQQAGKGLERLLQKLNHRGTEAQRAKVEEPHVCAPSASAYEAAIEGSIKLKTGKLSKFFFEQRNRVLARLDTLKTLAIVTSGETWLGTKALEDIFDLIEENKILWQRMSKLITPDFEFGVAQLGQEIGLDDFKVAPIDAMNFLSRREPMIKDVNQTSFEKLMGSLREGLAAGDTHEELVQRVKDAYGKDITDERAQTIATTETNIAVNSGRHEAMKSAGVTKKGWRTSRLAGVRPTHLANEDYSEEQGGIGLDERWPNGLLYPGDPAGAAREVINCRCFGYAILGDKSNHGGAEARRPMTYEEFMGRAG